MKRNLNRRGIRRMLVTTLGRIERLEDWLAWDDLPADEKPGIRAQIAAQKEKLKHYNDLAAKLLAEENA